MRIKFYARIDVSLDSVSVCFVDEAGKVRRETKVVCEPDALSAWFLGVDVAPERIGLEAGPLSQWLRAGVTLPKMTRQVNLIESRCSDCDELEALPLILTFRWEWNRIGGGWSPSATALSRRSVSGEMRLMAMAKWTVWVEARQPDGTTERVEIAAIDRDLASPGPDGLGLRLTEAKDLLRDLQSHLSQDQVRRLRALDRMCGGCGSKRPLHDCRRRQVDTLFGRVTLQQPRWRACACNRTNRPDHRKLDHQNLTSALIGARATPEFVRIQAELGARLSFREAARVMNVLLPMSKAANHTGIRRRLARTAERLQALDNSSPHRMSRSHGSLMLVSLDGAHIRAVPGFQVRHFEVTVGRVETEQRPARHCAVAPHVQATKPSTIGSALRAQGWLSPCRLE